MKQFIASLSARKKLVVCELFLVYFALGIGLIMLGSILPAMRDAYHLDYQIGGMLISIQAIGYLSAGFFTGAAANKLGQKRAYLILYALMPIGFAMMLICGAPLWLMAAMLLIGLSKGAITDYNNRIMSDYSNGDGRPLNLLHAFFAVGACISPLLVLRCLGTGEQGWRLAMGVALAVLCTAVVLGLFTHMDRESQEEAHQAVENPYGFFRESIFWQTMVIGFFYQAVEASVMGWMTSYYIDSGLLNEESAQTVTSLLWTALLIGRFACSLIAAYWKPWKMMLVMSTGIAVFLGLLLFGASLPMILIGTAGLGLCMSGMYGTSVANAGDIFSRYPACMGLFVTMTGVGGAITPPLVGLVANRTDSLRMGFMVLLVAAICLLVIAVVNGKLLAGKQTKTV